MFLRTTTSGFRMMGIRYKSDRYAIMWGDEKTKEVRVLVRSVSLRETETGWVGYYKVGGKAFLLKHQHGGLEMPAVLLRGKLPDWFWDQLTKLPPKLADTALLPTREAVRKLRDWINSHGCGHKKQLKLPRKEAIKK